VIEPPCHELPAAGPFGKLPKGNPALVWVVIATGHTMGFYVRLLSLTLLGGALLWGQSADAFADAVLPFLSENCYACHGSDDAAGKLNIARLDSPQSVAERRAQWEAMAEKIATGEMPPAGFPQPPAEQRASVAGWVNAELRRLDDLVAPNPGRVTARRLNRAEYNNTVRDLLGVPFRPADDFPQDDSGYGFDNIGDALSLSPVLMEKYLSAAEAVSRTAIFGVKELKPVMTRFDPAFMNFDESKEAPFAYDETGLSLPSALHVTHRFPADGDYDFTGLIRGFRPPGSEPIPMAFWIDGEMVEAVDVEMPSTGELSGQTATIRHHVTAGDHWLAVSFLKLYHGLPPEYNGPEPSKIPPPPPADPDELFRPPPGATPEEIAELEARKKRFLDRQAQQANAGNVDARRRASAGFFMSNLDVTGPYNQKLGPSEESKKLIYVCDPSDRAQRSACTREILSNLATRAYRRPAADAEVEELIGLVEMVQRMGDSFEEGLALAMQRVLISPNFLFRIEHGTELAGQAFDAVTDYELASRLSYFLWSSMPDDELMRLAGEGRLREETVLDGQIHRMLQSPKAQALVENFGGQWLEFRKLESVKPDRDAFPAFQEYLRRSMEQETERFFAYIVKQDRPITDFIDADYTFLNEKLADFYGIPGVKGNEFRKVDLTGTPRGGVLTQASILTVTSYANRTSPVLRGKWVLENILNAPPPPPPPGVPPLEESSVGPAASLREKMEAHRTNATCASCHARMDPLGFGLENFDAIGAWRTKDGEHDIDASGKLPDGQSFNGPPELRKILTADRDAFTVGMTERMLTYALGRGLESYDRRTVRSIAGETAEQDYRFSSLVAGIVKSLPFQHRQEGEDQ
jgi:hypothetical protein